MTVVSAAALCGLSLRQGRQVWKPGSRSWGCRAGAPVAGSVEQSAYERGIASADREAAPGSVTRILGPTLACEKLAEEALLVGPDTLVALLKRARIVGSAASPGESTANAGSVACAWDRWCRWMGATTTSKFEGRAAGCVLMVLIDDATEP